MMTKTTRTARQSCPRRPRPTDQALARFADVLRQRIEADQEISDQAPKCAHLGPTSRTTDPERTLPCPMPA